MYATNKKEHVDFVSEINSEVDIMQQSANVNTEGGRGVNFPRFKIVNVTHMSGRLNVDDSSSAKYCQSLLLAHRTETWMENKLRCSVN